MSEKLQKMLARCGLGSRREMESWIADGRVEVNGEKAHTGMRVTNQDTIKVDGNKITLPDEEHLKARVLLYHKPEGEVCSRQDPEGRPTVFDHLPELDYGRWINVGRLDINTTGLLLFTNDGDLANKLMHPSSHLDREYAVRVFGEIKPNVIKNLITGVKLEDGTARFEEVVEIKKESRGKNHWFYVVIANGRNRIVRRLWESQGLTVNRLKRVRFGPIILGSMPKQGDFQVLTGKEIRQLQAAIKKAS